MRAGQLRHRINLLEPLDAQQTASGRVPKEWRAWATGIYAEVLQTGGSETQQADRKQAGAQYTVRLRWLPSRQPAENERIEWESKTLSIGSATDKDGRKREQVLTCTEVRA